jgi:hypothetical protein
MKFLTKWLGLERPGARVGLRPHKEVELEVDYPTAYAKCKAAIETVLGATVITDDERGALLEAGFGLVNSERLRCTFWKVEDTKTGIRVEAFFPAGVDIPEKSRNVDALAEALA